jgi:cell fate regulator YaaT (PSP1 superfamily)
MCGICSYVIKEGRSSLSKRALRNSNIEGKRQRTVCQVGFEKNWYKLEIYFISVFMQLLLGTDIYF